MGRWVPHFVADRRAKTRTPPCVECQERGLGNPHQGGFYGGGWRAPFRKHMGAPEVPHGTSGTNSPYGMRSWKCRITAHSVRGTEIASASPAAVLNSTTYVPSFFGPKIMIRFLPMVVIARAL